VIEKDPSFSAEPVVCAVVIESDPMFDRQGPRQSRIPYGSIGNVFAVFEQIQGATHG
jgi:hypothetical protein